MAYSPFFVLIMCILGMNLACEEETSRRREIIEITKELINSIRIQNFTSYRNMTDPHLTGFEDETGGYLVEGLDFHKFYFTHAIIGDDCLDTNTEIQNPYVHLLDENAASIAFVRITQCMTKDGQAQTKHIQETRIWQKKGNKWQNVHFHKSKLN